MRPGVFFRLAVLAANLLAASLLLLGPGAAPAGALSPVNHLVTWLQRMPREVVIDGHCQVVDSNGVPLTDSLSWQRTGHDAC